MADPNRPSPTAQPQNDGLMQAMFGQAAAMGGSIEDILQQTMLGLSGRQGLTSQPLVGVMPQWFKTNPSLVAAVQKGQLDPYTPTGDPTTWRVYVGGSDRIKGGVPGKLGQIMTDNGVPRALSGDDTATVASVKNQPFLWDEDKVAEAIKKFQDAGATGVTSFDTLKEAWDGLVDRASKMYSLSSGQRKVTPWDALDLYKNEMKKAGTLGGSGGSGGSPTTVTQTSRSVSTITNGDGWSALQNTLSRMLGRDPSEEEVRDFVGRMNHLAAKNPTITTATRSGIGTAHESQTSRTRAGFNSNDILENAYKDAQSDDDYAEFQSASTYYNAALSALGAIGG